MAEPFIGQIMMVGWNFATRGWALCHGQLLPISQYSALFSLLGTTFGGDGRTTFGLPDMQGRVPIGQGRGPGLTDRRWGEKLGQETHTMTVSEMPSHKHDVTTTLHADELPANTTTASNGMLAEASTAIYQSSAASTVNLNPASATTTEQNTGGGLSFNIMQPSLCIYFEIALVGVFPSRN